MIGNGGFGPFSPMNNNMDYAAQEIKKYSENVARRKKMGLEGDGSGGTSFAARLKAADEFLASGESCGATDSIGIILRQMGEAKPGSLLRRRYFIMASGYMWKRTV